MARVIGEQKKMYIMSDGCLIVYMAKSIPILLLVRGRLEKSLNIARKVGGSVYFCAAAKEFSLSLPMHANVEKMEMEERYFRSWPV